MTKYKVLKEFIDEDLRYFAVGDEINTEDLPSKDSELIKSAIKHRFIEELPENTRWRAKSKYYWIDTEDSNRLVSTCHFISESVGVNEDDYKFGNYFKSQETAEQVAKALKLFFEWLHDPEAEQFYWLIGTQRTAGSFEIIANEARKMVLRDDKTTGEE